MEQRPDGVVIYDNVIIGKDAIIDGPCVIGKPPSGRLEGELRTSIGAGCHIRPFTVIYAGSRLGDRLQTGQGACVRENNMIGNNVVIGTNAVLEPGNRVGNNTRVHTGCFLECATIGQDVFIGPNTVFTDDPHPPCPRFRDCVGGARVEDGAKIGANTTILPGVTVGELSLVGAGSVVTKDVPSKSVVAGNPAKVVAGIDGLVCRKEFFSRPYAWEQCCEHETPA